MSAPRPSDRERIEARLDEVDRVRGPGDLTRMLRIALVEIVWQGAFGAEGELLATAAIARMAACLPKEGS